MGRELGALHSNFGVDDRCRDLGRVDTGEQSSQFGGTCEAMSTSAEVQDFGFSDSTTVYPRSLHTNGAPRSATATRFEDDDIDDEHGFFTTGLGDVPLDMFKVERAQLNLNITIHQLVVSNNILIMASTDSKLYKIDLTLQEEIVGTFLPNEACLWCRIRITEETRRKQED